MNEGTEPGECSSDAQWMTQGSLRRLGALSSARSLPPPPLPSLSPPLCCSSPGFFFFFNLSLFLKNMYLAALGLNCIMWDLPHIHGFSGCGSWFRCSRAYGILVSCPGMELTSPAL